jgi:hypothetical protein
MPPGHVPQLTPPPNVCSRLLRRYPEVTSDTAARFLHTYATPAKAYAALQSAAEWRRAAGMVDLLHQPQPDFETIKRSYLHGALGWSRRRDCLVLFQADGAWRRGYAELRGAGVTDDQLLRHLVFCCDYSYAELDPRREPHGRGITVVDLSELRMADVAGDAFRFISAAAAVLGANYPGRVRKIFLVNAPAWWGLVWRVVSPLVDAGTREKMAVFPRSDQAGMRAALLQDIDEEVLPQEYGGTRTATLYESDTERAIWEHVWAVSAGSQATAGPGAAASSPGQGAAASGGASSSGTAEFEAVSPVTPGSESGGGAWEHVAG